MRQWGRYPERRLIVVNRVGNNTVNALYQDPKRDVCVDVGWVRDAAGWEDAVSYLVVG